MRSLKYYRVCVCVCISCAQKNSFCLYFYISKIFTEGEKHTHTIVYYDARECEWYVNRGNICTARAKDPPTGFFLGFSLCIRIVQLMPSYKESPHFSWRFPHALFARSTYKVEAFFFYGLSTLFPFTPDVWEGKIFSSLILSLSLPCRVLLPKNFKMMTKLEKPNKILFSLSTLFFWFFFGCKHLLIGEDLASWYAHIYTQSPLSRWIAPIYQRRAKAQEQI